VLPCALEKPAILVVALLNLLFGIGFALVARERIRADGPFATPAFPLVALHAAAVVAPVALYFYVVHPAWCWMYAVDISKLGGAAVLPLMVGHAALVIAAWYLGAVLLRRRLQNGVLGVGGATVLILLVLIILGRERIATASTFIGYWQNRAEADLIFKVKLGWAFAVSLLALSGSAIYVAIELARDGRRVRSR
jgi:hypothetical protein